MFVHHLPENELTIQCLPLAARMRPQALERFVGQEHIIGPNTTLIRAIQAGQLPSLLLWGPSGSGKTSLAWLISKLTNHYYQPISAVASGVGDLRKIIHDAQQRLNAILQRTILFVDEIHRFNKAQQDAILPYVEDGTVIFIGATTENPSFEVISPLLSRSLTFVLKPLENDQIMKIILNTISDTKIGLGNMNVSIEEDALQHLINFSNGDARTALNTLEVSTNATKPDTNGNRNISVHTVGSAIQQSAVRFDKNGDQHYDTISAFIKSVRGSDPDATVFWLARMLESGEDPMFICRRMIILAAEDIGIADPIALSITVSAQQAVHFVGLPEGAIPLAEAAVYLATAPKSNSAYIALNKASKDARGKAYPVPLHLRNATTRLSKDLGYGKGYKYSHDHPNHFARMSNLPSPLQGKQYYYPSDQGYERKVAERIRIWWGKR